MVKQLRDNDVVGKAIDRGDGYFHWLQKKSGLSGPLSSMLADTEFISVDGLDDTLIKKAREETRRAYAEDIYNEDPKAAKTLCKSIRGNTCLFEVIFCLANAVNEMFEDTSAYDGVEHFFGILMDNCGLSKYDEEAYDLYPDQVKTYWENCIKRILERSYSDLGEGGLFPITWPELYSDDRKTYSDRRFISLWQQLNDWVDEHTNEDGEWVD